jgi:hypothetical protein
MFQIILIVIVGGAVIFLNQTRRQTFKKQHDLKRNQRGVNIAQQWLDPILELTVVGGVIWSDLQHGWLPWVSLLLGLAVGIPVGIVRGRFMYVRSVTKTKIVVERNAAEISILAILIVIKFVARSISAKPTSAINLIAIALLGIGLASSVGRVAYITVRHYQASRSIDNSTNSKNTDINVRRS